MKCEEKEKDVNLDEVALTVEVDSEVIDGVRKGEITQLCLNIDDDNKNQILENINGHLILVTDELPNIYLGCYLYNNGEFPYAIRKELQFIVLHNSEDRCLARILEVDTEPAVRFRFQGPGKPSIEDPNGDSCIWKVMFNVVPVLEKSRKYLMRWNPSISSFKESNYEECVENMNRGIFRINWSIYEWEEARIGDMFYMLRVGDDKAGIVFNGMIVSNPYVMDDWAGSSKRRLYVDMACVNPVEPGEKPELTLEKLQSAIPEYDWAKGHSGEQLPDDVADKFIELYNE
jgi:hypothetical protein